MPFVRYEWPGFSLTYDAGAGTVVTHFPGGRWSGGGVVPEDAEHAALLGCDPLGHRLRHELAHHVVALACGWGTTTTGCPIVWRDAHRLPQEASAGAMEHGYTAFTYYALGVVPRPAHGHEWGKLGELHDAGVDLPALAARYRWLLGAAAHAGVVGVVG